MPVIVPIHSRLKSQADIELELGWQDVRRDFAASGDPITRRMLQVLAANPVAFPSVDGIDYTSETGGLIYASLLYKNARSARDAFASDIVHPVVYLRDGTPAGQVLTKALLAIDPAAVAGRVTAFGMGAILAALNAVNSGEHIVASKFLFGTTTAEFLAFKRERGIDVTFVDMRYLDECEAAIQPGRTAAFFWEPVANPGMNATDTAAISALAHRRDILCVVDNSATPLDQSLTKGADIVAFSTTKLLGLGKTSGGAFLLSQDGLDRLGRKFSGQPAGFPVCPKASRGGLTQSPEGSQAMLDAIAVSIVRHRRQIATASIVAQWLADNTSFEVHSPNLDPQVDISEHTQLISIDCRDQRTAFSLIDALAEEGIFSANNFGGPRTTVVHPATTTQMALSLEQQREQGIGSGLVRWSVGVEHPAFLIDACSRAL